MGSPPNSNGYTISSMEAKPDDWWFLSHNIIAKGINTIFESANNVLNVFILTAF